MSNESKTERTISCPIKVFNADNKLIYQVDMKPTSTILQLKVSLHRQSLFNIQPSDQQILFNNKECINTTTFQQLSAINNNHQFIKLHATHAPRHQYSVQLAL